MASHEDLRWHAKRMLLQSGLDQERLKPLVQSITGNLCYDEILPALKDTFPPDDQIRLLTDLYTRGGVANPEASAQAVIRINMIPFLVPREEPDSESILARVNEMEDGFGVERSVGVSYVNRRIRRDRRIEAARFAAKYAAAAVVLPHQGSHHINFLMSQDSLTTAGHQTDPVSALPLIYEWASAYAADAQSSRFYLAPGIEILEEGRLPLGKDRHNRIVILSPGHPKPSA